MGLRFRKSISIIPGVKLNFGETGMSVSTGVPGFRKTIHSSGKVTTSVGIPGTGIYYTDSHSINKPRKSEIVHSTYTDSEDNSVIEAYNTSYHQDISVDNNRNEPNHTMPAKQIDFTSLKSIHKTCDDTIDWTEVLVSPNAPDETYNQEMWNYYHDMAPKVLSGDIDAYLQLIYEVNPLDDLLEYGGNYEFGTDNPQKIEVEFTVDDKTLASAKASLKATEYESFVRDFVASVCIRIARDMFALLPVNNTIVHAIVGGKRMLSADFDRKTLSKIKFDYSDPAKTIQKFIK